ncbi:MAG: PorP/SprF family type IX secretion system membrane protein [Bacteroidota bacterium]
MQHKLILLFFVLAGQTLWAQQLPIFTQYQEAYALINPAAISNNYLKYDAPMTTNLMYRYQWVGLDDAPRTLMASHEYLNEDYNILFGGSITHDQTGPTGFTGLMGRFAYLLQLSDDHYLSAGLSAGVVQYRVDGSELDFAEQDEVESAGLTSYQPDFALGAVWYYMPSRGNRYYAGVSVPQTFGFNLDFRTDENDFSIQRVRHYYAFGGVQFALSEGSWIEADVWLKYVEDIPFHFDVNFRYEYQESFWVGVGGSMAGASHAEAGVIWDIDGASSMRIGYGYDHFFTDYSPAFGSAHEIKIAYVWPY